MTTYNPHNIKDELYYRELFDILYNEYDIILHHFITSLTIDQFDTFYTMMVKDIIKDICYYICNKIGIDADEYYNNLPPLREIPNKYLHYRYMK